MPLILSASEKQNLVICLKSRIEILQNLIDNEYPESSSYQELTKHVIDLRLILDRLS